MSSIYWRIQYISSIVMTIYAPIGIVTNCLNCRIFGGEKYRKNACAIFCAANSLTNVLILAQVTVENIFSLLISVNVEETNPIYCKMRLYLRHCLMMNNRTFMVCACAACFALSSERVDFRSFAERIQFSYRLIGGTFLFWFVVCLHTVFNTNFIDGKCFLNQIYSIIFTIYIFIVAGIFSPLLMLIFIRFLVKNLSSLHQRIAPQNQNQPRIRSRDLQLIRMLLFNAIVYLAATISYPIFLVYSAITDVQENKSEDRKSIEQLVDFFVNNLIFCLNNLAPFFVYFYSSSKFRQEVRKILL